MENPQAKPEIIRLPKPDTPTRATRRVLHRVRAQVLALMLLASPNLRANEPIPVANPAWEMGMEISKQELNLRLNDILADHSLRRELYDTLTVFIEKHRSNTNLPPKFTDWSQFNTALGQFFSTLELQTEVRWTDTPLIELFGEIPSLTPGATKPSFAETICIIADESAANGYSELSQELLIKIPEAGCQKPKDTTPQS